MDVATCYENLRDRGCLEWIFQCYLRFVCSTGGQHIHIPFSSIQSLSGMFMRICCRDKTHPKYPNRIPSGVPRRRLQMRQGSFQKVRCLVEIDTSAWIISVIPGSHRCPTRCPNGLTLAQRPGVSPWGRHPFGPVSYWSPWWTILYSWGNHNWKMWKYNRKYQVSWWE